MIKSLLFCLFFSLALTSVAQQRSELKWKNVETLKFDFPLEDYTSDSIFFFHSFLKRTTNEGPVTESPSFSFSDQAKP